MSNRICSLSVTIDGVPYIYEAHTMHRVAEILAGTIRALESGETNEFGQPVYRSHIENFEILYFQEV